MLDTTDDIAEGISFQAFEDDCRLLATLLHDVLLRELGPRFIHILERIRILAQVHLRSAAAASIGHAIAFAIALFIDLVDHPPHCAALGVRVKSLKCEL